MPVPCLKWLLYADPRLAPLWRSRPGSITPIRHWLLYADHRLAPICRSVTVEGSQKRRQLHGIGDGGVMLDLRPGQRIWAAQVCDDIMLNVLALLRIPEQRVVLR